MLKRLFIFACLTVSISANAAIISLDSSFGADTITRDTSTGFDWLDVSVTNGLSYDQVSSQLGAGGDYEGYRYATAREAGQLMINFGYTPRGGCSDGFVLCSTPFGHAASQRDPVAMTIINTLGGANGGSLLGGGVGLWGVVTHEYPGSGETSIGTWILAEKWSTSYVVDPYNGQVIEVIEEWAYTTTYLDSLSTRGSFLIAPSPVPLPAAAWLFGSAVLGLMGVARRKKT